MQKFQDGISKKFPTQNLDCWAASWVGGREEDQNWGKENFLLYVYVFLPGFGIGLPGQFDLNSVLWNWLCWPCNIVFFAQAGSHWIFWFDIGGCPKTNYRLAQWHLWEMMEHSLDITETKNASWLVWALLKCIIVYKNCNENAKQIQNNGLWAQIDCSRTGMTAPECNQGPWE